MFGRRKKNDDRLGPSTGWVKWATKFFRFILYPFIHPLWFFVGVIVVLVALIALPSYNGVEFSDIPEWYKKHIVAYYEKAQKTVENGLIMPLKDKTEQKLSDIVGQNVNVKSVDKKPGKDEMVSYDSPRALTRKVFEAAQDIPVDVKATLERTDKLVRNDIFKFRRDDNLGLIYMENPEDLTDIAEIVNANEIKVGAKVLFLYGIYAEPSSQEGIAAMQYLQNEIAGKTIKCRIVAYTQDATATGICVYDGININQRLVDLGYSKDVSLN